MEIFVPGALYYHTDEIRIKSKLADCGISDERIGLLTLDNSRACAASGLLIERELEERELLYRSRSQLIDHFLRGERELFASMDITEPDIVPPYFHRCAWGIQTYFRYGYEKIRVNIWLRRIWQECQFLGETFRRIEDIDLFQIQQLHFLGTASWDSKKKEIDMIPFIITQVTV